MSRSETGLIHAFISSLKPEAHCNFRESTCPRFVSRNDSRPVAENKKRGNGCEPGEKLCELYMFCSVLSGCLVVSR